MILAIDPSASRTGFCKGEPGGPVKTGSLGLGSFRNELGPVMAKFDRWLEGMLDGVSFVFYEQPINSKFQSLASRRVLYALGAMIEYRCIQQGVRVREVNNATAKKLFYGSGRFTSADKKEHGVGLAEGWGFAPANHDEADACAVFIVGVQEWFPEDFGKWTERRAEIARMAGGALL